MQNELSFVLSKARRGRIGLQESADNCRVVGLFKTLENLLVISFPWFEFRECFNKELR